MRKILYPVMLLLAISCSKEDGPKPGATPDFNVLARQQAPFGTVPNDVKLKQVTQDSRMSVTYTYEGDFLSEEKRYDATTYLIKYQVGKFTRQDNLPESFQVSLAHRDAQNDTITSYNPLYAQIFVKPKTDSTRQIKQENTPNDVIGYTHYFFDKEGYITRREFWADSKTSNTDMMSNIGDITHFVRDARHNVIKSMDRRTGEPAPANWVEYTYDLHPNPFFKLGRDWNGDISVRSLSPNNLTRETYRNAAGVYSNIYYTYEYLPNGYPKKVTIKVESPISGPWSYTLDFTY